MSPPRPPRSAISKARLAAGALVLGYFAAASAAAEDTRIARVGLVSLHAPELASHVEGIREELRRLGHTDGRTIEIEAHFTNGDRQRVSGIVKSFVERQFDVVVPWTAPTVRIAKNVTQTVPMVMIASDPVAARLVQSLSPPGRQRHSCFDVGV
jgi:putative ABC transport system substrate-binding protein